MRTSKIRTAVILMIISILSVAVLPFTVFADESDLSELVDGLQFQKNNKERFYLGETIKAGDDDGYAKDQTIKKKDVHYGWKLGEFYISGFSRVISEDTEVPIFLKNVGDTPTLFFNLEQDIDELDGNSKDVIYDDPNGYDKYFGTEKTDFGKGALIIRHTDYQNHIGDPVIYTDYLPGITQGADTKVELLEEGDYEVSLDYTIRHFYWQPLGASWISNDNDYKIFFKFSVRNGNCMVFPFDVKTKAELTNTSITPNGFYLDLAKSKFLDITIKKEVLTEGAEGLTEDVRFNRPAKEGDEYTEEGIYTIKVHNRYTNEDTTKKIYVGDNSILKAYITTGLSIQEINTKLENGYTINDDGAIVTQTTTTATTTFATTKAVITSDIESLTEDRISVTDTTMVLKANEEDSDSNNSSSFWILLAGLVALIGISIGSIVFVKKKLKNSNENSGGGDV